ncbi:hypothetical protein ACFL5T_00140 [Gemmatimonadota bacterium]
MFRNRPTSLALIGMFVWLTACTSYKQIQVADVADHGKVRVTTSDGERETIHEPRVEADTIKGQVNEGVEIPNWVTRAIPLDQVSEVGVVGTNGVRTAFLVLGSLAVVFLLVAAACSGDKCGGGT